jgi:antitoxin (DNA-binding transcriptional repressor) of toxin-antitoxin stability system
VSAKEFKAKCLALLDAIEETGRPITITRRGKPVAMLERAKSNALQCIPDCCSTPTMAG